MKTLNITPMCFLLLVVLFSCKEGDKKKKDIPSVQENHSPVHDNDHKMDDSTSLQLPPSQEEDLIAIGENRDWPTDISIPMHDYFNELIVAEVAKKIGPTDSIDANMILEAVPGLRKEDFDNVPTRQGILKYDKENNVLNFIKTGKAQEPNRANDLGTKSLNHVLLQALSRLRLQPANMEHISEIFQDLRDPNGVP